MPDSRAAVITLHSSDGTESTVQHLSGEVVYTKTGLFIRYEEPDQIADGVATRTTIIWSEGGEELKVLRHGGVQSQQLFRVGERLPGFYRSPFTTFNLSTHTRMLEIALNGGFGTLKWTYDFYVYEELSGQFTISMQIQEEPRTC